MGPGSKARPIGSTVTAKYPGRRQPIHAGSYIRVAPAPALDRLRSITITANIWPTTPGKGEQLLIGRGDHKTGFALVIGPAGGGALRIGEALVGTGEQRRGRPRYGSQAYHDTGSRQ